MFKFTIASFFLQRLSLFLTPSWDRDLPTYTTQRYPHIQRGNYASVTTDDVDFFNAVLKSPSAVLTNHEELDGYNTDWMKTVRGDKSLNSNLNDEMVSRCWLIIN